MMTFSPRFQEAFHLMMELHGQDRRKGTQIPTVAHLLGVCSMVLTDCGDEDEAIAALLHDTLEDHPEKITRADIESRFGQRVKDLVEAATDTPPDYKGGQKPPWKDRKQSYIEHIAHAEPAGLRVPLADKVDNMRAILTDYRQLGDELWSRFKAGKADQIWYFRSLVSAFRQAGVTGPMFDEFDRLVCQLERLAAQICLPSTR